MRWRRPWRRQARATGLHRSAVPARASRSRAVWADLIYTDGAMAQAAKVAAQHAEELTVLERVLNEPTTALERGVRVPPFVLACRRTGR